MRALDEVIGRDAERFGEPPLVVMLGDYIDRGPFSAQVLDHLLRPDQPFERINLAGNHEFMLLAYLDGRVPQAAWQRAGGSATCRSLGIDYSYLKATGREGSLLEEVAKALGERRLAFLRAMPVMVRIGRVVMVHAGLRPSRSLDEQDDTDIVTIRDEFYNASSALPYWVIHGHTPVNEPFIGENRVNVDTHAWLTGRLTAFRMAGRASGFLTTAMPPS